MQFDTCSLIHPACPLAVPQVPRVNSEQDWVFDSSLTPKDQYRRYLQTNHWFQIKALKIKSCHRRCQVCGARKHLEVHHRIYRHWFDCQLSDLVLLCRFCHHRLHTVVPNHASLTEEQCLDVLRNINNPIHPQYVQAPRKRIKRKRRQTPCKSNGRTVWTIRGWRILLDG